VASVNVRARLHLGRPMSCENEPKIMRPPGALSINILGPLVKMGPLTLVPRPLFFAEGAGQEATCVYSRNRAESLRISPAVKAQSLYSSTVVTALVYTIAGIGLRSG